MRKNLAFIELLAARTCQMSNAHHISAPQTGEIPNSHPIILDSPVNIPRPGSAPGSTREEFGGEKAARKSASLPVPTSGEVEQKREWVFPQKSGKSRSRFCGSFSPCRPIAVAWPYGESMFRNMTEPAECPSEFAMLGLYCRIGSLRENRELPGVKRLTAPDRFQEELTEAQRQALKDPEHRSETGEIATNPERGTLRVVTPRTESLSFFQNGLDGKILSVSGATPTFQIVTASAMDGKTLAGSGRILLFHQSDVTNRNIRFSSESMTAVEHWGIPESLIRRATAKVTLQLPAGTFAVRAIGLDGLPKADIPAEYREGKLTFPIDTAAHGGTMIYLVERQ